LCKSIDFQIARWRTSIPSLQVEFAASLLERNEILIHQAKAAAPLGQHTAKAQARFGAGVSILRHAAKCSSGRRLFSCRSIIFSKN
jgi:hypothetical protein